MRRTRNCLLFMIGFILVFILFSTLSVKPAYAACGLGDIICEGQQAIQQLIDNYVGPLQAWVQFQINKMIYQVAYTIVLNAAELLWTLSKAFTTVGVGIGVITNWVSSNFFQPMIGTTNQMFASISGVFFFVAIMILGFSYTLAVFVRLDVVSPRNAVLWYVAAAIFFQIGPSFYSSLNELRQTIGTAFYAAALDSVQNQSPFQQLASGDNATNSPIYGMATPCNNFGSFLQSPNGTVNGLDIGLAYQKADGYDVVAGGTRCLGAGTMQPLPRIWFLTNGYFDANKSPDTWIIPTYPDPVDSVITDMRNAVLQGFAGISRLFNSIPLVWFGIIEQLVGLCLMLAQGLTFISFSCAVLFAFFKRTEGIAWAIVDQWVALIVQTVIISLVQGLVVALYISAASTGSPLITLAVSVAGLVLMGILLFSGIKAVWSAFNRLFVAFGQATGGAIITPGAASQTAVNIAALAASGGMAALGTGLSLGASGAAAYGALNKGATPAQAAGIMFGENNAFTGAAATLYRLPGLRGSPIGEAADQFLEGARLQGAARELPVAGIISPFLGASLLTNREPDAIREEGSRPLLNPDMGDAVTLFVSNPRWKKKNQTSAEPDVTSAENEERLETYQGVRGEFKPKRPITGYDDGDDEIIEAGLGVGRTSLSSSLSFSDLDQEEDKLNAEMREDLEDARDGDPLRSAGNELKMAEAAGRVIDAANRLGETSGQVGRSLGEAGSQLERASRVQDTQQRMKMYEGTFTAAGPANVAGVMGDVVALLQQQRADAGKPVTLSGVESLSNFAVANSMAQVMNLTPLGDGKPPIREDLGRFQMYADQAMKMGLSPTMVEGAALEVRNHGSISPETRVDLQGQVAGSHKTWRTERIDREIDALENRAALLPDEIRGVGAMPVAVRTSPPTIDDRPKRAFVPNQASDSAVRGDVTEPLAVAELEPRAEVGSRSKIPVLRPPSDHRNE